MRLSTVLFLLLGLSCLPVHARQTTIHRCVDAQGHQVFTDRSCADMQATPALPPATPPGAVAVAPVAAPRAAPRLCADSVDVLRQQIVDAFAVHDPNRMAGLMLWNGYSKRAVVGHIRALSELMRHPLVDIGEGGGPAPPSAPPDMYDASQPLTTILASDARAAPAPAPAPPDELVLVTGSAAGTRDTAFPLARRSGCVWLLPSG